MFEVNEKNNAVTKTEHYDGETLKDVYGAAYRPEGNKARYIETRVYLQQVRDEKHRVDLIKSRIQYRKDYFSEHYRALEDADYATISNEDYLKELQLLDIEVGKKNNLGKIKSFVLLQVLLVMLGEQIYVFCSDDKNARNGATNFEDVRCISLVSVFSRLKEESNWTLADAEPYIESLIAFYQEHHQTTFRVMEASEVRRLQRIPCRQVLQEIFDGKFIELKNGMLRYKQ